MTEYQPPDDETREELLKTARDAKEGYNYRVYLDHEGELIETIPVRDRGPSAIQSEPTEGYLLVLTRDPFMSYDELDRQIERVRPGGDPAPPAAVPEDADVTDGKAAEEASDE